VRAVQAGEAVEDRPEGVVPGAEADVDVLVELDEEEREPQFWRIDSSAKCIVKLEETRIAVFMPAIATGSSNGSGGQGPSLATTRRKKYEAKNAPKSITSETMKRRIPRVCRSIRELWLASGGWAGCSSAWPTATEADSITRAPRRRPPTPPRWYRPPPVPSG
jgi:hypothetical protein